MLPRFRQMSLRLHSRNQRRRQTAETMRQNRRKGLVKIADKIRSEIYQNTSQIFALSDCDSETDAHNCDVIELVFE